MRRALVGGLGLSLGLAAGPAFAQERAATFGRPVAVLPAAPVVSGDPGITPAGLFDRTATPTPSTPQTLPGPRPFTAVVPGTVAPGFAPQPIFMQPGPPAAPQPMTPGMPMPMPGGQKPFTGQTAFDTMASVVAVHPPAVHELNPAVPPGLSALIARLMAKDPAWRPGSGVTSSSKSQRIATSCGGASTS